MRTRISWISYLITESLLILSIYSILSSSVDKGNDDESAESLESDANYNNASQVLDKLLKDYDVRLRPGFGGEALQLKMDIVVASFDSISEVNMDYTITMYLHQYWRDERLAWRKDGASRNESMTLSGDFAQKIWVPDTFLANDKHSFLHDVTEMNKMLRLYADGDIAYGMRFTSTLACNMNLRYYPLDAQNCTVEIESYGYTTKDVYMAWIKDKDSVQGLLTAKIPQFTILDYDTQSVISNTSTGSYQRLILSVSLKRNIGYFIFQTYLPCILIVMLSWVSFWINHEATSARVALGITTVLTMTTISTGVRQSLPRISYVKSIDIYLVMCFVFVFAALLEYAAVNYSYWGSRAKKKTKEGAPGSECGPKPRGAVKNHQGAVQNREPRTGMEVTNFTGLGANYNEMMSQMRDVKRALASEDINKPIFEEDSDFDADLPCDSTKPLDAREPSPPPAINSARRFDEVDRMSPIPSLRQDPRQTPYSTIGGSSGSLAFQDYPRSATYSPYVPGGFPNTGSSRIRFRGVRKGASGRAIASASSGNYGAKRTRVLQQMKKRARSLLPRIRDINLIDKYSRVIFPVSFIVFNAVYWSYYTVFAPDLSQTKT